MNLKIEGDLNVNFLSADEMREICLEKIPPEMIVAVLHPGKAPWIRTYAETEELLPDFMEKLVPVDFGRSGLTLYYPDEKTLWLGKDIFLFDRAVICSEDDDGDLWSLSGGDLYNIFQYVEENTVTLCADGRDFPAIRL